MYENGKQNENVNPGISMAPLNFTSVSIVSQCELITNKENNHDKNTPLNMLPVLQTRRMSNGPEIPTNCNSFLNTAFVYCHLNI